jgi:hypothetical protein
MAGTNTASTPIVLGPQNLVDSAVSNMNTMSALTIEAISQYIPTATVTPSSTLTQTQPPTNTATLFPTRTRIPPTSTRERPDAPTRTATHVPPTQTDTPLPTYTDTPLPTDTDTPVPTDTPLPTDTDTPIPTDTPEPPPTETETPIVSVPTIDVAENTSPPSEVTEDSAFNLLGRLLFTVDTERRLLPILLRW